MKRLTVFCLSALLTGTTFTATSQKTLIPNNTEVFKLSLETHGSYNEAAFPGKPNATVFC